MAGSCDAASASIQANDNIDWNVQNQVQLLLALMGHKPVGVAKYFQMACILEKFSSAIRRFDISSKVIWDRLDTMYDLQALEETEGIPFPNETQDFVLPDDFGNLVEQKKNGTMPPPRVPSPPPDIKKEETNKDIKKDSVKDSNQKKDLKEITRKLDDKKSLVPIKDIKKEPKDDTKKEKRHLREGSEDKKKDKEMLKGKEPSLKEQRGTKRGVSIKDDEDSSVSSSGSLKKGREKDNSDTEEATASKRLSMSSTTHQATGGKGKRQTRLSQAKVSDDSGSNKSVSPVPVSSPKLKRRRHV